MILTMLLAFFSLMCNDTSKSPATLEKDQIESAKSSDVIVSKDIVSSSKGTPERSAKKEEESVSSELNKQKPVETEEPEPMEDAPQPQTFPIHERPAAKTNDQAVVADPSVEMPASDPQIKQTELPKSTGGEIIPEPSVILDVAGPDHAIFNSLLQSHVTSAGKVNYTGIKSNISKLDEYIKLLQDNPASPDWSRNARLAYWINAYNAFTIKLIVNNFPLNSIMDLDGGKPWDKSWISIGDQTYSLNDIEHKIIRPKFGDPRIHFAVNCAAKSCPPIANKAYTENNVNSLLEQRTKQFINDASYNNIENGNVKVSKIFDWYGEDFGDLVGYLNKYLESKIDADTEISFIDYDWNLNN